MTRSEDDRESVDRAFAELVAGYHLTADRPADPRPAAELTATGVTDPAPAADQTPDPYADLPTLPPADPTPVTSWRAYTPPTPPDEPYVPEPLPPLARPGGLTLLGWGAVLFAAVVVLAAGFGLGLPAWVGWLAVCSFIGGFLVLLLQLPRHRPPGSGDGAVL